MPKTISTYTQDTSSAALYVDMMQTASNAIRGAGLVQLSAAEVAGQVNWTTARGQAVPTAVRDFEVFKLSDGLQDIFIRVDYIGGNGTTRDVRFTAGFGVDTSGVIATLGSTPVISTFTSGSTMPATAGRYMWSYGDGSSLVFMMGMHPVTTEAGHGTGVFILERFRNANGSPNGNGFMVWSGRYTIGTLGAVWGGAYSRTLGVSGGATADFTTPILIPDSSATTGVFTKSSYYIGDTAYAFPFYGYDWPQRTGPSRVVMAGVQSDFPRGQALSFDRDGTMMDFVACGDAVKVPFAYTNAGGATPTSAVRTDLTLLFRWQD